MIRRILEKLGITRKTDDKEPSEKGGHPSFDASNKRLDPGELLIEVAQEFEDEDRFRTKAQEVASRLSFNEAKGLTRFFHKNPPEPEHLKSKTVKYGLFGVWMNICQNAVFEILFNYKEQSIPTLYSIGFGEYDWTQYKAIHVLCRLAKEGIQTDNIINDIGEKIQSFRYEAVFPSIASLSSIPGNKQVPSIMLAVFEEYSADDPIDGLAILRLLSINYPQEAIEKLSFIKALAKGEDIEDRSPLLDGAILSYDEAGNETFSIDGEELTGSLEETHRINAALLYYSLDPKDQEINDLIDHWEKTAQSEAHRSQISEFKRQKGGT
ncbi:hypothetical protein [Paraflavitalea sp. CAU 1676]|uniref:hypothetical protein n=1 Tax=Paraflavitalea sp. CAU 1676 TaxID=3032598 RepID=UPI0023DACE6B|nr:hypothetical protein [Paraflavitalea sp. CAU 1676]MDF2188093.1 hypothetical protein [Paraflavitalea sp. CAU 1676]